MQVANSDGEPAADVIRFTTLAAPFASRARLLATADFDRGKLVQGWINWVTSAGVRTKRASWNAA